MFFKKSNRWTDRQADRQTDSRQTQSNEKSPDIVNWAKKAQAVMLIFYR